jgi:shikimate dehydrogenase
MSRRYRFGLLGHDISYSKSPSIFSILAEIRKIDIDFETIDVTPGDLDSAIDRLKQLDSFSVTIPYKQSMLSYMDVLSDNARTIGAINSVKVENRKLHGYNTDGTGFIMPLREAGFGGGKILVLGAGGAARAMVYALVREYPGAMVLVCGRNAERITHFVADIRQRYQIKEKVQGLTFDALESSGRFDLIVNCTPVGGATNPDECPLPDTFKFSSQPVCYDLIYEPVMTVFLRTAEREGCRIIGGLMMLIRQAVESYGIWTGDDFDRDQVSREIFKRLHHEKKGDVS